MAGFTIICNDCGNKLVAKEEHEAINEKIDIEIGEYHNKFDNEINLYTLVFCENCDNSVIFV